MDKKSAMWIPVGSIQAEICNHERIRDNHAKNKDKKNVDYLNWRIEVLEKAIEILKEAETSKDKALNIGDVVGSTQLVDWNKKSLDELADYLEKKYMFSSTGDAKAISELINFYKKNK